MSKQDGNRTIMFYIGTLVRNGAERVVLQLAHHFANEGYKSIIVNAFAIQNEYPVPKNVDRVLMRDSEKIIPNWKKNVQWIKELRSLCKAYKPVALISFLPDSNYRAIISGIGLPTKNIVTVRNDPKVEYRGKLKIVGKYLLPFADGCVFQTEDAKRWFPQRMQKKSKIIPNVVHEEFFCIERNFNSHKNIVALGRLVEQKNHKMLIRAYAKVARDFPERKLQIYGEGPLRAELLEEIDALGMTSYIELMGATDNVSDVLRDAKLFILSSDYEGMPNALMEALAAGVPCISTDCPCGGPKSLIESGQNGVLVPVGDVDSMAYAIRNLLTNPKNAKRMGETARAMAKEFRPEVVFPQWVEYVERVIENKR